MNQTRLYQIVGERVKQHRTEAGMTQAQLAKAIGVSRVSVTNIEGGNQRLSLHVLYEVAERLQAPPHDLIPTLEEIGEKPEDSLDLMEDLNREERMAIRQAIRQMEDADS